MRKLITLLLILSFYSACESIDGYRQGYGAKRTAQNTEQKKPNYKIFIFQHPDFNFSSIDPDSVIIYDGFAPTRKYFIVGKILINEIKTPDRYAEKQEIKRKVAAIGGQAVIIVDTKVETKEFGGDEIYGAVIPRDYWIEYYQLRSNKITASVIRRYGYVVRWIEELDKEQKTKLLKYLFDEVSRQIKNEIAELKKIYPFAKEKEVLILLTEKDENGNSKYTVEQAMRISHERNRKK